MHDYWKNNAATAKSLQSSPTLSDPIDDSPPGSPIPGILQARTLQWVAISFSSEGKTIALTIWTFVGKVLSLLFNVPSRFVIAFLPSSKHLLMSWLQSASALFWNLGR